MANDKCTELRDILSQSVQRNLSDAVLLSGGLDSSIIANIAAKLRNLIGVTVVYRNAPDLMYAKILSEKYSIIFVPAFIFFVAQRPLLSMFDFFTLYNFTKGYL